MNLSRTKRLEELTRFGMGKMESLMRECEFVVTRDGGIAWSLLPCDPKALLKAEAKKRWGVSESTSQDYARVVFSSMEPKILAIVTKSERREKRQGS